MNSKGCYLACCSLLLIYLGVVDSITTTEFSFSNTSTTLHLFGSDASSMLKSLNASAGTLEYLIIVEVNVSEVILIEQIRSALKSYGLPLLLDNTTEITSWNITTSCNSSNASYQCECQDQYFWPCDKCTQDGFCDVITNKSCGCTDVIPYDGQFCQPMDELNTSLACPASNLTAEYLLEVEIDAENDIYYLQSHFEKLLSLSPTISNTKITEINVTTVCNLYSNGNYCNCQDQYFWPCDKCRNYDYCDVFSNASCRCSSTTQYDGQLCQTINELESNFPCSPVNITEYMVEVELDMVDLTSLFLIEYQLSSSSSFSATRTTRITETDFTTVCLQDNSTNSTQQCSCQDQYFLPCDKCTSGTCDVIANTSCGCSYGYLNDGQFCKSVKELNASGTCSSPTPTLEYMIEVELDSETLGIPTFQLEYYLNRSQLSFMMNNTVITDMKFITELTPTEPPTTTTAANTTTTAANTTTTTVNTTEPPTTTTTANTTTTTANTTEPPTTTTTANTTTSTTTITTTTITTTTLKTSTPKGNRKVSLSMKINDDFHFDLTNKSSQKYKKYETDIKQSIDDSYSSVAGYVKGSAEVNGFSAGSVVADFSIETTSDVLDLTKANNQLASSLSAKGYTLASDPFSRSESGKLNNSSSGQLYPGENLILTCPHASTQWTKDGTDIFGSTKYLINNNTLTVTSVTSGDSGVYACKTTWNSIPYIIWENITIPDANLQLNFSKAVECKDATEIMRCCAEKIYEVDLTVNTPICIVGTRDSLTGCITCSCGIKKSICEVTENLIEVKCELQRGGLKAQSTLKATNKAFKCFDETFGGGSEGEVRVGNCDATKDLVGNRTAQCSSSGQWDPLEDNCVLRVIQELKDRAENLNSITLPGFMADLRRVSEGNDGAIAKSPATISTIVNMLEKIAKTAKKVLINEPIMKDFLETVDVVGAPETKNTWETLNNRNTTTNTSSALLHSAEGMGQRLLEEAMKVTTNTTDLIRTNRSNSYLESFHQNKTEVSIPVISDGTFITIIVFSTFDKVLPVRSSTASLESGTIINGDLIVVQTNKKINNIRLTYTIKNETLTNPQCVFWNFTVLNGTGGWDSTGCKPITSIQTGKVTCECNHTTSFSMLMSPNYLESPALDIVTYVFLGISMASLVLCLIIELIIWKTISRNDTSYMRHVAIVNIAVSLLIACIWFIIGAAIVKKGETTPVGSCTATTFFTHYFFLAVFFWMLVSALLLLYRAIMILSRMSRATMMAISFSIGYGGPLIIAVVTVASTAGGGGYIQEENYCWLNWSKTKALLAFVIPVFTIVAINLLVLIVVLIKILMRGVNSCITRADDKHPLLVILKCVGILTPLFGLTWGFGIGTMVSLNFGIHAVFVILTSLQGLFILVFGLLVDSKVREILVGKLSLKNLTSNITTSTSGGQSSSGITTFFQRIRHRNVYNVSEGERILSTLSSDTVTSS